jgi:putative flavoprotein involved in K+ transport
VVGGSGGRARDGTDHREGRGGGGAREGGLLLIDVAVVGGGQSALAAGYYLRRTPLHFTLFDDQTAPGGAWQHTWPSLRLFSPAQWSSLPGWLLPRDAEDAPDGYPSRDAAVRYLAEYERRYELPVERPVLVHGVHRADGGYRLDTSRGDVRARAVVSATGTWSAPVLPSLPDQAKFRGVLLHSATYAGPTRFARQRVIVVGGGNSGAQIVAELSEVARITWVTREPPHFLPDDVDGRYLFEQATARYRALQEGRTPDPPQSLGDVVWCRQCARRVIAACCAPSRCSSGSHRLAWCGPTGARSASTP